MNQYSTVSTWPCQRKSAQTSQPGLAILCRMQAARVTRPADVPRVGLAERGHTSRSPLTGYPARKLSDDQLR